MFCTTGKSFSSNAPTFMESRRSHWNQNVRAPTDSYDNDKISTFFNT
ncbi:hypothetical protein H6G41_33665 [Tolypothrix sp. FACHB-123]|nr:hypothetical protein [Tolypothrix sp. FACHB-123]